MKEVECVDHKDYMRLIMIYLSIFEGKKENHFSCPEEFYFVYRIIKRKLEKITKELNNLILETVSNTLFFKLKLSFVK